MSEHHQAPALCPALQKLNEETRKPDQQSTGQSSCRPPNQPNKNQACRRGSGKRREKKGQEFKVSLGYVRLSQKQDKKLAQQVKCLLCKHKDPSLDPRTHVRR